jgi:prevent-host-death family protein
MDTDGQTEISVGKAKENFSRLLNRVAFGNERIVVTSHGRKKVAIISLEDLQRLEQLEHQAAGVAGA